MTIDLAERVAELERQLAQQRELLASSERALTKARTREAAIQGVLRVMNQLPEQPEAALDAIATSAAELCTSDDAAIWLIEAGCVRVVADAGTGSLPRGTTGPIRRDPPRPAGIQALLDRRTVHVPDCEEAARHQLAGGISFLQSGVRSTVATLLWHESEPIGYLQVFRQAHQPYTDEEIVLLETYAAQASIAVHQNRLFERLQQHNRELGEALAQQTATAEVLRVIATAPASLTPVLDALAEHAARLCAAPTVILWRVDGDVLRPAGVFGRVAEQTQLAIPDLPIARDSVTGRAVVDRTTMHVADLQAVPETFPGSTPARTGGLRAALAVPLLREGVPIGVIAVWRADVHDFTPRQIALIETFADQAVIAIENVRLFRELQERTQALAQSVDELQALSEVGQAVSSSLDLRTVLTTIIRHAVVLSQANFGSVWDYDPETGRFVVRTQFGWSETALNVLRRGIRPFYQVVPEAQVALPRGEWVTVEDLPGQGERSFSPLEREFLAQTGVRAVLLVPLMRDGSLQGALAIFRTTPGAFAERTIRLLTTFAAQSVVALQNARLYDQIEQQRRELEVKSRELEEKGAELEAVSRHKSAFLANMSHELRTPLNGIIGFSEVLLDPQMPVDETMRTQFLDNIYQSGKHLLALINDILDLSKVEAGKMELHPEDFDLAEALQGVHAIVRALADKKQQHVRLDLPDAPVTLHHDAGRFKQVLFNLLSNAVKFTPEGGRVSTRARRDEEWIEVAVSDTGIGIAPADQGQVFQEFQQIDSGYARQQQGTGLGLALVRNFVRLMGGDVTLRSAVGEGSTFTVRLPLARPAAPSEVAGFTAST